MLDKTEELTTLTLRIGVGLKKRLDEYLDKEGKITNTYCVRAIANALATDAEASEK